MNATNSHQPSVWQIISGVAYGFAAGLGYADATVPEDAPMWRRQPARRQPARAIRTTLGFGMRPIV